MRVTVLFFGVLKEMLASESQTLDLPQGATVDAVLGHYRELLPQQPKLWSTLAIAVNQSYAPSGCLLRDGDEVALLPPVSGGCDPVIGLGERAHRFCVAGGRDQAGRGRRRGGL